MRIGSLFSGAGGLDMAVEKVFNGHTVWQCEVDPAASKVLAYRWGWRDVPNLGDITKVDWYEVPEIDVMCGGFPCQDVSAAGKRAGIKTGTRSGLWALFAEVIDIIQPPIVVIENVRGLLSAEAHRDVEPDQGVVGNGAGRPVLRAAGAVLGDLADLGYDARWATVSAASVGAPHRRERVFIVAHSSSAAIGESTGGSSSQETGTESSHRSSDPGGERTHPNGRNAADSSRNGWDERRPESARLVGGSDAAVSGDGNGLSLELQRLNRMLKPESRWTPAEVAVLLPTPRASDPSGAESRSSEGFRPQLGEVSRTLGTAWGKYEPAIRRWEQLTRPAPEPTEPNKNGNPRLAAAFSEWLMGWPDGWVTDPAIGISRNDQLRIVGNGVCPQQAWAALRYLLAVSEEAAYA